MRLADCWKGAFRLHLLQRLYLQARSGSGDSNTVLPPDKTHLQLFRLS